MAVNKIIDHYPSAELRTPTGWTCRFGLTPDQKVYKEAIDPDGYIWVAIDSDWRLYVSGFGAGQAEGCAIVEHTPTGNVPVPTSPTGVITLNRRKIKESRWYH